VYGNDPLCDGVPEIIPVTGLKVTPIGNAPERIIVAVADVILYCIGVAKEVPEQIVGEGFPETKATATFSFIVRVPDAVDCPHNPKD
jgi:hypothetical protein